MKTLLKISKIILKYILIFIIVLLIAFGLLATPKIPKQAIMENMQESVIFFYKMQEWMKFRNQIITVICIVLIFAECLNYKMLFKEIKIGRK